MDLASFTSPLEVLPPDDLLLAVAFENTEVDLTPE